MSHVDEGTLHAYLDGELTPIERAELERHLSVCAVCRGALSEARTFMSESDGMIRALDVVLPGGAVAIPAPRRPLVHFSTLAWAASLILAVGLGYSLRNAPTTITEQTNAPAEATGSTLDRPATPVSAPAAPLVARGVERRQGPGISGGRGDAERSSAAGRDQKVAEAPREAQPDHLAARNDAVGVAAPLATGEVQQPAPRPAAAAAEPRPVPPSNVVMIDGAPVDTTVARRAFGPAHTPAPRRITMDEAVTHLGGTIRLIDGLSPQRVELLAGVDVAGADPGREVVRIYYEEPDLGLVTLDQQRPGPSFSAMRSQSEVNPDSVTLTPAPTTAIGRAVGPGRPALASLTWRNDGAWLSLTSRLTKDQMTMLQARVK